MREMYFWDKHKTITSYYELLFGKVCDKKATFGIRESLDRKKKRIKKE